MIKKPLELEGHGIIVFSLVSYKIHDLLEKYLMTMNLEILQMGLAHITELSHMWGGAW